MTFYQHYLLKANECMYCVRCISSHKAHFLHTNTYALIKVTSPFFCWLSCWALSCLAVHDNPAGVGAES